MHATNRKWCDFFLCTTKDSFLERIIFDEDIFAVSVAKAKVVYEKLVLPKIFSRDLQTTSLVLTFYSFIDTLAENLCFMKR